MRVARPEIIAKSASVRVPKNGYTNKLNVKNHKCFCDPPSSLSGKIGFLRLAPLVLFCKYKYVGYSRERCLEIAY